MLLSAPGHTVPVPDSLQRSPGARFPSFQQYDTSHDICAPSDAPRSPGSTGTPAEGPRPRPWVPVPVSVPARSAGRGGCAPVPAAPDDYKTRALITASRALTGKAERAPGCGGAGRVCPCQQRLCPAGPRASLPRRIPRAPLRTHVLPALRAAPAPGSGGLAPSGSAGHGRGSPGRGPAVPGCPCPAPASAALRVPRASPLRGQAGGSRRHPRTPPRPGGVAGGGAQPRGSPLRRQPRLRWPPESRGEAGTGAGGPPLLAARGSTGPPPPLRSFCLPGPGGSAAAAGAARPRWRCGYRGG